jgi:hypothetical protein
VWCAVAVRVRNACLFHRADVGAASVAPASGKGGSKGRAGPVAEGDELFESGGSETATGDHQQAGAIRAGAQQPSASPRAAPDAAAVAPGGAGRAGVAADGSAPLTPSKTSAAAGTGKEGLGSARASLRQVVV